VISFAD